MQQSKIIKTRKNKRKQKPKTLYLISLDSGTRYISGGTFRFGGKKYVKTTTLHSEAKRYTSKIRAVDAGRKLARSCSNIVGAVIVEEEDGFQNWKC